MGPHEGLEGKGLWTGPRLPRSRAHAHTMLVLRRGKGRHSTTLFGTCCVQEVTGKHIKSLRNP